MFGPNLCNIVISGKDGGVDISWLQSLTAVGMENQFHYKFSKGININNFYLFSKLTVFLKMVP